MHFLLCMIEKNHFMFRPNFPKLFQSHPQLMHYTNYKAPSCFLPSLRIQQKFLGCRPAFTVRLVTYYDSNRRQQLIYTRPIIIDKNSWVFIQNQ